MENPRHHEKKLKYMIVALVNAVLVLFFMKWILYWNYNSHSCLARPLQIKWKSSQFCVNATEAFWWRAPDVTIISLLIAFGVAVIYGFIRRYKRNP